MSPYHCSLEWRRGGWEGMRAVGGKTLALIGGGGGGGGGGRGRGGDDMDWLHLEWWMTG